MANGFGSSRIGGKRPPPRTSTQRTSLPLDDEDDVAPVARGPKRKSAKSDHDKRKLDRLARDEENGDPTDPDDDADDARPSQSRALVDTSSRRANLPAETERALRSKFGEHADTIINMMDYGDTDGAITLTQRALLTALVSVLPVTENVVHTTGARYGVYQFNQTLSNVRELLADLQATRDKGLLGQHIVERCVRPAFLDTATQIVNAFTQLNDAAAARMEARDAQEFRALLESFKKSLADYMLVQYQNVSAEITKSLT